MDLFNFVLITLLVINFALTCVNFHLRTKTDVINSELIVKNANLISELNSTKNELDFYKKNNGIKSVEEIKEVNKI